VHYSLDPDDESMTDIVSEILLDGADLTYELSGSPLGVGHGDRLYWIRRSRGHGILVWEQEIYPRPGRAVSPQPYPTGQQPGEYAGFGNSAGGGQRTALRCSLADAAAHSNDESDHSRFHFLEAEKAYTLIDQHPEQVIQVILDYA